MVKILDDGVCEYCGGRLNEKDKNLSTHHRKAKAYGGTDDDFNLHQTIRKKHRAFHCLFGAGEPTNVVAVINQFIDPDYEVILVRRKR